jgi:hypothetical protein
MKKILISIGIGVVLSFLAYLYCVHPRSGPTPFIIYFIVPIELVAMASTKNPTLRDIIFCAILLGLTSVISYLTIYPVIAFRAKVKR